MIQVSYFKGDPWQKDLQNGAIHHHFELCGWSETRVVAVFSVITAVMCLIALLGAVKEEHIWNYREKRCWYSVREERDRRRGPAGTGGACPVIYDGNADIDREAVLHKIPHRDNVTVYAGELPEEVQKELDLVVLSPGVPTDLPLVKSFYQQGLPSGERWNWRIVWEREECWRLPVPTVRPRRPPFSEDHERRGGFRVRCRQYRNPLYVPRAGK